MALTQRLADVFIASLELDPATPVDGLTYRGIPEWDSLGHMSLVAAIEDEFDVQLDTDQVIGLSSFTVATTMLKELGVDD
ncbi:acyl carrier protein [Stackebrandtia soli]|uniref:acyl carrier protein n=1 Tax=Stackebrandtia soli TaxID=1892856 RepID=UPI0039EC77C0